MTPPTEAIREVGAPPPSRVAGQLAAVCSVAFAFRFWLILRGGVTVSPDGQEYLRIAGNLARHGCFSASDPVTAACLPTWSHHPPAYPVFIAVVESAFGHAPLSIAAAQTVVFCAALWYVMWCAAKLQIRGRYLILAGLAVALSPVTAGWSRWILPETLSAAALLWLVAECLNALAARRIPVVRFAAAIAVCGLTRWDMILAAIPFTLVAWRLQPPRRALATIASVGSLAVIPYLAWIGRAALVGLPLFPPALPTIEEVPVGIQSFWKATAVRQTSVTALIWPVWSRRYTEIEFDASAFAEPSGNTQAEGLVRRLALTPDGAPVPADLDARFAAAARTNHDQGPIRAARLFLLRTVHMWGDRDRLFDDGYRTALPGEAHLSGAATVARILFLVLTACAVAWTRDAAARTILAGVLLFAVARTLFLVNVMALETRYLSACLPAMEFAAIALSGLAFRKHPAAAGTVGKGL